MDFNLTDDQKLLQKMVRDFAEKEMREKAVEIDESREFPFDTLKKMASLGLMGMVVPEEYHGVGMDFVSVAIAVEEISRVCASTGVIVAVQNTLAEYPIVAFGTEEQKKKYLPDMATGKKIGCICLTEPNAGSDVAGFETVAVDNGDHWVLNGAKRFITNGTASDVFITFAYTDREKRHKGMDVFIVDKDSPGLSVGKHENLMGIRATGNCEVIYDNCIVPKENLLGPKSEGFKTAMKILDVSRIDIGAQAVGIAQSALDEAVKYSRERVQFGVPICTFQMIQDMLAQMATKIEAARLLVRQSAFMKDAGIPRFSLQSSMGKYYASEIAVECARMSLQIHGGVGYTKDYPIERIYRDAKILEIYEGTTQVQKIVIARSLLK
ncbi:acyl-CoA dehydrogenase [bacterium]|nr:acyl-CoA dehydrogenase [bacterium]